MEKAVLIIVACAVLAVSAWSPPYPSPAQAPLKKYSAPYRQPVQSPEPSAEEAAWSRTKRDHYGDHHHHHHQGNGGGVTGPVHTFVKTDKKANYKWGVRHHVGPKYV